MGLGGVCLVPFEQNIHHTQVPFPSGSPEWRPAAGMWLVEADHFLFEKNLHHSLVDIAGGKLERCSADVVWLIGVNVVPS